MHYMKKWDRARGREGDKRGRRGREGEGEERERKGEVEGGGGVRQ